LMDKITLHGIQFYGYHGVTPEETVLGTRFSVDVELYLDLRRAGRTDDISNTVDYTQVFDLVVELGTKRRFKLIESIAELIAAEVLRRFPPVKEVVVRVKKLSPPIPGILEGVSVEIKRSAEASG